MTIISEIKAAALKSGMRTLQIVGFGKLPYFGQEYGPYGFDSCAVPGINVLYTETGNSNTQAVNGYANVHQQAVAGESSMYATDSTGTEQVRIWCRTDGTIEIGGNAHHMTQYEALNSGLQAEVTKINAELTKIAAAISSLGGTYAKVDVDVDISAAELNNIKTQ